MANNKKTNRLMRLAYLICVPAVIGAMCCCSPKKGGNAKNETTVVAEEVAAVSYSEIYKKPSFDGGDANNFAQWAYSRIKYPEKCIEEQVEGRVLVEFTISSTGQVCDVKVLRGVCPELDEEAMRVVKESPSWTTGETEEGKAVPVSFVFPVVFALR